MIRLMKLYQGDGPMSPIRMPQLDIQALERECASGGDTDCVPVTRRWLRRALVELTDARRLGRMEPCLDHGLERRMR